jgi:hypothetical protein
MTMDPKLIYEQTDIPPGVTCAEYRRDRPKRAGRWTRLRAALGAGRTRR